MIFRRTNDRTEDAQRAHHSQESKQAQRIVLVGHCTPDQYMLRSAVQRALPDIPIEVANDDRSLGNHLHADALLLVNRVLDGRFAAQGGIDLIRSAAQSGARVLLISNLADAQQQAQEAGALPGFGKTELYDQKTADRLHAAVAALGGASAA